MTPTILPACVWSSLAAVGAIYLLLAVWRENVSLRPLRIGLFAAAAAGSRVILLFVSPLVAWDWLPLAGCLLAAGVAPWIRGTWLIRASPDEFRRRLDDACRGLHLEYRESVAGCLDLVEREQIHRLRIAAVSRACVLIRLPRAARPSKVALLVDWLAKQYPGPVPRIHIHLSGTG